MIVVEVVVVVIVFLFDIVILFNGGHVLQLMPETVTIHRWMRNDLDDYDG
mgnify:CR=1 FL=1